MAYLRTLEILKDNYHVILDNEEVLGSVWDHQLKSFQVLVSKKKEKNNAHKKPKRSPKRNKRNGKKS